MSATTPHAFEIRDSVRDRRHALVLSGELDIATAPELAAAMWRVAAEEPTAITIDLRRLTFMDSTGLHAILDALDVCAAQRCEFALEPGPRQVQRLFELCGLAAVLPFGSHGPTGAAVR